MTVDADGVFEGTTALGAPLAVDEAPAVRERLFGGSDPSPAPAMVGPYAVTRRIGRGGMGLVYECVDPRLDRRVAVKLVRPSPGAGGETLRRRLVREAQALARISHPNVIEVYDVGMVDDEVFIAMELVEGPTLGRWLTAAARQPGEILSVFVAVARGLAAAHERDITHRDFKPDNVIVAVDGRPRVLDFGIAQAPGEGSWVRDATDPSGVTESKLTACGTVLGTPAYMAPEQACGDPVDARTDQFSFCVVLFEALYGRRPFSGTKMAERIQAMERGDLQIPAAPRVHRRIRDALARGLQFQADLRHLDMNALIDALQPPRRSLRWVAGSGALIVIAAVGVGLPSDAEPTAPADPCLASGSTESLAAIWHPTADRSIREAFAAAVPVGGEAAWGRTHAALDAYATAWAQVDQQLCVASHGVPPLDPPIAARGRQCLVQAKREFSALLEVLREPDTAIVSGAAKAATALASPRRCAEFDGLVGDEVELERTAAARDGLARTESLFALGKYDAASDAAAAALRLADVSQDRGVQADAHLSSGKVAAKRGELETAVGHLEQAVFSGQEAGLDRTVARAACQLTYVRGYLQADFDAAEQWSQLAQATIARMGGDPLLEAERHNALGAVYTTQGRYTDAIASFELALHAVRERLGEGHPNALSTAMNLGALQRTVGNNDKARQLLQGVLAAAEKTLGPDHPEVAEILTNLGTVDIADGHHERAIAPLERALAIHEAVPGPPSTAMAILLGNLAICRMRERNAGLEDARRAVAVGKRAFGDESPKFAQMLGQLGEAHRRAGRHEEALGLLQEALRIKRAALGEAHPDVATTLLGLSNVLSVAGRNVEAKEQLDAAAQIFTAALPADHPRHALIRIERGRLEVELGHAERALAEAEAGLSSLASSDALPDERALAQFTIARALRLLGRDPERATEVATAARAALLRSRPDVAEDIDRWLAAR